MPSHSRSTFDAITTLGSGAKCTHRIPRHLYIRVCIMGAQLIGNMFRHAVYDNPQDGKDYSLLRLPPTVVALIIGHVGI